MNIGYHPSKFKEEGDRYAGRMKFGKSLSLNELRHKPLTLYWLDSDGFQGGGSIEHD